MSSEIKELSDRAGTLACKTEIAATETMIEERIRPRSGRRNHLRLASMRIRWTNAANGAKTPKHNSSTRRSPPGSDYGKAAYSIRSYWAPGGRGISDRRRGDDADSAQRACC